MAYVDFLRAFASLQGFANEQLLLSNYERYGFHLSSRDRAAEFVKSLERLVPIEIAGARVLDIGCGYGAYVAELAKAGAIVTGVDTNAQWLELAAENARDDVEVRLIRADAASRLFLKELGTEAQFDIILVKDVMQYVFDVVGLLENLKRIIAPQGRIYFRTVNGRATKHILADPVSKIYGISLLPNENWAQFKNPPSRYYPRRLSLYEALFRHLGFSVQYTGEMIDADEATTRRHITRDQQALRRHLKVENFNSQEQLAAVRTAFRSYAEEFATDLEELDWTGLYLKYRELNWEGVLTPDGLADAAPGKTTAA